MILIYYFSFVKMTKILFSLKLSSPIEDLYSKYELSFEEQNTTNIEPIETVDSLSFIDESRKIHKCMLSSIDFSNANLYCCFWCRHPFTTDPIGCPVKYIPNVVSRSFLSEITKEKFIVRENISKNNYSSTNTDTFTEVNDYYETDGIFCSVNCCYTFILENKKNPLYVDSEYLLHKIHFDIDKTDAKINPSPHWRLLKVYGGTLDISSFRSNISRLEYVKKGLYKPFFKSLAHSFEEKIKF